MTEKIHDVVYKMIDKERITSALDLGNRYDANILFKYSSLTKDEFEELLQKHPLMQHQKPSYNQIWERVLAVISVNVAAPAFNTWFKDTYGNLTEDTLIVYCESAFQREWLNEQHKELI